MIKIGLTGGIACGKTTICQYLRASDAKIIDADAIVHELLLPQGVLWHKYCDHFGQAVLKQDGTLDRRKIGELVFAEPQERQWLAKACHVSISTAIEAQAAAFAAAGEKAIILDIPLLFEAGWQEKVDKIWVVYLDKKNQLQRLRQRDGYSFAAARARIRAQWPLARKLAAADVCINNGCSRDEVKRKVQRLWKRVQNT